MTELNIPRTTLEQWRILQAVIDHGGYAQAAAATNRSQSSISYTLQRMQEKLGLQLLEIDGRKARLTPAGQAMLRQARYLLDDAATLELNAGILARGWETEITLAIDVAYPTPLLVKALRLFEPLSNGTRIQLREEVLSGVDEALLDGRADLGIGTRVPQGFLGDSLHVIEFVAVSHPDHPLHLGKRVLTLHDLRHELQVVIRDSGHRHQQDLGWLGADQRWTVTSMETAITLVSHGIGFAWLPKHQIEDKIEDGTLKPLPLSHGQSRNDTLYLIFGHQEQPGPAAQLMAKCFHDANR